jgi:hypothetical protein
MNELFSESKWKLSTKGQYPLADFSHLDIKGADFTLANFASANFNSSKANHKSHWIVIILVGLFFLVLFSGLLLGFAGAFPGVLATLSPSDVSIEFNYLIFFNISTVLPFFALTFWWWLNRK